jgi:hypothetical protein
MKHARKRREIDPQFLSGNPEENWNFGGKWQFEVILKKQPLSLRIGFIWLRVGFNGDLSWIL